jgi:hypothetical protein
MADTNTNTSSSFPASDLKDSEKIEMIQLLTSYTLEQAASHLARNDGDYCLTIKQYNEELLKPKPMSIQQEKFRQMRKQIALDVDKMTNLQKK